MIKNSLEQFHYYLWYFCSTRFFFFLLLNGISINLICFNFFVNCMNFFYYCMNFRYLLYQYFKFSLNKSKIDIFDGGGWVRWCAAQNNTSTHQNNSYFRNFLCYCALNRTALLVLFESRSNCRIFSWRG